MATLVGKQNLNAEIPVVKTPQDLDIKAEQQWAASGQVNAFIKPLSNFSLNELVLHLRTMVLQALATKSHTRIETQKSMFYLHVTAHE